MEQNFFDRKISKMFVLARVFAIITVLSAHLSIKNSPFISNLYSLIGSIGVIVFLITSGYYFKKQPIQEFVKKKFISIIIPWLVLGTLVYIVNSILTKSNIEVVSYLLWMVGHRTYLYFVVVLLSCFVLFYYHNNVTLIIAMFLNIASIFLTSQGILEPIIKYLSITNYLNIFNWVGFFALGIMIRKIPVKLLYNFFFKSRYFVVPITFITIIILALFKIKLGYFSTFGWLFELFCSLGIFSLCTFEKLYNKCFEGISNISYSIYLIHMLFIGVFNKIINYSPILSVFSNLLVLFVVCLVIYLGYLFSKLIRIVNVYSLLLGIRIKKYN